MARAAPPTAARYPARGALGYSGVKHRAKRRLTSRRRQAQKAARAPQEYSGLLRAFNQPQSAVVDIGPDGSIIEAFPSRPASNTIPTLVQIHQRLETAGSIADTVSIIDDISHFFRSIGRLNQAL